MGCTCSPLLATILYPTPHAWQTVQRPHRCIKETQSRWNAKQGLLRHATYQTAMTATKESLICARNALLDSLLTLLGSVLTCFVLPLTASSATISQDLAVLARMGFT